MENQLEQKRVMTEHQILLDAKIFVLVNEKDGDALEVTPISQLLASPFVEMDQLYYNQNAMMEILLIKKAAYQTALG